MYKINTCSINTQPKDDTTENKRKMKYKIPTLHKMKRDASRTLNPTSNAISGGQNKIPNQKER